MPRAGNTFIDAASIALLLQGPPLSGKSNAAMTFPDPYILDCDMKLENATRRFKEPKKFWYDRLLVNDKGERIPEHERWDWACNCINAAAGMSEVRTIIIDSLTFLCDALIAHILKHAVKEKGKPELIIAGEKAMEQSYWTPFKMQLQRLIMAVRGTNKYFVCTVHETAETDKEGNVIKYVPCVPGQLRDKLGGMFTDVWRCSQKDVPHGNPPRLVKKFIVQTAPSSRMQLGNSLGLPPEFELTWEELAKYMTATKQKPFPVATSAPSPSPTTARV